MLDPRSFLKMLDEVEVRFFCGVPDSLLKGFCKGLEQLDAARHVVTANEGSAIGLAVGYHLATGAVPLVYLQNSGLGNTINPLVSLADPSVYGVPLLLLIGWRGQPGEQDEPQHIKQGAISQKLLSTMDIPYQVLPMDPEEAQACIMEAKRCSFARQGPYALLVRPNTFSGAGTKRSADDGYSLKREEAMEMLLEQMPKESIVVATTGKISRELFEYRQRNHHDETLDFLMVGSMGHASQIALGIALAQPSREVYCFDGDGAMLMHMGAFATIGALQTGNFRHILFNNGVHDSVGGQPTTGGFGIDFCKVATACKYPLASCATTKEELHIMFARQKERAGPSLLEIRLSPGTRTDLGRPSSSPVERKLHFMRNFGHESD